MLHEMKQKLCRWMGLASNERNKNTRKTLFKCPFIKSIISSHFFLQFFVEAEAKMINFVQKVFLFCFEKRRDTEDKWNGLVLNWRRKEIFWNSLTSQSPGHHRRTSKHGKASQNFCDLIFLHYRREKLLFVLQAFVTDFRSSLLFTFICFVPRRETDESNNGEKH